MYKLGIVQRKETVVNSAGKPMNRQWLISLYNTCMYLMKTLQIFRGFNLVESAVRQYFPE